MIDMPLNQDVYCLAENIYYEARGESRLGQIAVGLVVMNRISMNRFPNTICDVVYDDSQFSWTIETWYPMNNVAAFNVAYEIALELWYRGNEYDITFGADHYHKIGLEVGWADPTKIVATFGNHVFYKLYDKI